MDKQPTLGLIFEGHGAIPWLSTAAASVHGRVSVTTIVRAARRGDLKGVKVNGERVWRFRREWVDEWLMNGGDRGGRRGEAR